MEEKLKERIVYLGAKLMHGIDVEKLVTIIKRDQLLPAEHVIEIDKQPTNSGKRDRLLNEIVTSKDSAYHKLLQAVEQCRLPSISPEYSTVSPAIYIPRVSGTGVGSRSASLTSDSDDDVTRGRKSSLSAEIRTACSYSASGSFPVLIDRCSPLPISDETIRKQMNSENRYDWFNFKLQFEGALRELETLKQQNAEKIGQLSKEVEYFRNMYKKSESLVQNAEEEARTVKMKNVELMAAKQKLQEALAQMEKLHEEDKKEITDLQSQHHKILTSLGPATGSADAEMLTELYDAALEKLEILHKDYDVLRESYADLASSHSGALCQLEAMEDIRKQLEEVRRERDVALMDKTAFQQQCTAVIQNWDQSLCEHRKLQDSLDSLRRKHENCSKEQRKALCKLKQLENDCNKALRERDATIQEYTQVMSERDTVHKEIEQLQDKLTEVSKLKDKDKALAEQEIDHLKQELSLTIASRDKYKQESQAALDAHSRLDAERRELQHEYQLMEQQRDAAYKEMHQMEILIKETYEKTQKEKAEEMGQVAKETEVLKKQIDKIKNKLTGELVS